MVMPEAWRFWAKSWNLFNLIHWLMHQMLWKILSKNWKGFDRRHYPRLHIWVIYCLWLIRSINMCSGVIFHAHISLHLSFQVSSHILDIFFAMRKPGTNIQILQQNLLQKHRYIKCKTNLNRWTDFLLPVQQLHYKVSTSNAHGHKEK